MKNRWYIWPECRLLEMCFFPVDMYIILQKYAMEVMLEVQ